MSSKWQRELEQAWLYRSAIALCGNIRDLYPYGLDEGPLELLELDELLARWMSRRVRSLLVYDPIDKFRWVVEEPEGATSAEAIEAESAPQSGEYATTAPPAGSDGQRAGLINEIHRIADYLSNGDGRCCVMQFSERVAAQKAGDDERLEALAQIEKLIHDMRPGNHLVLVYLFSDDIPRAIYVNEPRATVIEIPSPDRRVLKDVLERHWGLRGSAATQVLNVCHGLSLREIDRIAERLDGLADAGTVEKAVRLYKFGEATNHWDELDLDRLANAPDLLKREIKGQDEAVEKVAMVLVRARADIQRTTGGNPSRPRGVLFFAGPTGVGKTMMAQKLAEFLFGDQESAYLRFDMSEYQQDFQVSRLYGAPPGYIGFEQGGSLTSPMQANPFRVILFDEFEKADARVYDIFLQILGDGRLTDSKGVVAHFSESIIIFTSNLGADAASARELERIKGDEDAVRQHFVGKVEDFFRVKIGRPELLNRIGRDNIVVFNFIEDLKVATEILRGMLVQIEESFNRAYGQRSPRLSLTLPVDEAADALVAQYEDRIRVNGGREVENLVNERVRDVLALRVLEAQRNEPADAVIRGTVVNGRFKLEITRA